MLCAFFFRLEKEYTTIKTKEMEEQVEIKVCGHTLKSQSIPCKQFVVFFSSCLFAILSFSEVADREQASEAEDRHTRESE